MDLPPALRRIADEVADGVPLADLAAAAAVLSARYRDEVRDGRYHLSGDLAARAYLAARLPATFAAAAAALASAADAVPDLDPADVLDVGAGPGTATLAAKAVFPALASARLAEGSPWIRAWGERLLAASGLPARWIDGDIATTLADAEPASLVTLAYVLDEIAPSARPGLVARAFALARDALVIVEPGTPAGWRRILEARDGLIAAGATIAAPCPHQAPCPLVVPDWCHFAARLARSRLHRQVKRAEVPYEDEKYLHLVATRLPVRPLAARVIAPVHAGSGRTDVKLCLSDGSASRRLVTRRDGDLFRRLRRADWGDAIDP